MENKFEKAYWVDFPKKGKREIGYLGIASIDSGLPFDLKRSFWTLDTPPGVIRGKHAHYKTEMVILALQGKIKLQLEYIDKSCETFILDNPYKGVFIPKLCWHDIQHSSGTVQLVMTNSIYKESDYIRDEVIFNQMQEEYRIKFPLV